MKVGNRGYPYRRQSDGLRHYAKTRPPSSGVGFVGMSDHKLAFPAFSIKLVLFGERQSGALPPHFSICGRDPWEVHPIISPQNETKVELPTSLGMLMANDEMTFSHHNRGATSPPPRFIPPRSFATVCSYRIIIRKSSMIRIASKVLSGRKLPSLQATKRLESLGHSTATLFCIYPNASIVGNIHMQYTGFLSLRVCSVIGATGISRRLLSFVLLLLVSSLNIPMVTAVHHGGPRASGLVEALLIILGLGGFRATHLVARPAHLSRLPAGLCLVTKPQTHAASLEHDWFDYVSAVTIFKDIGHSSLRHLVLPVPSSEQIARRALWNLYLYLHCPGWLVEEETGNERPSRRPKESEPFAGSAAQHPFHALSVLRASDPFDDSLPAPEPRDQRHYTTKGLKDSSSDSDNSAWSPQLYYGPLNWLS
ncbi:hypothetical protein CIB48_g6479 [Xylaria polymorpha]|nr:hypothetical protein CIB48_g6479 [Xylaria polymorpha]